MSNRIRRNRRGGVAGQTYSDGMELLGSTVSEIVGNHIHEDGSTLTLPCRSHATQPLGICRHAAGAARLRRRCCSQRHDRHHPDADVRRDRGLLVPRPQSDGMPPDAHGTKGMRPGCMCRTAPTVVLSRVLQIERYSWAGSLGGAVTRCAVAPVVCSFTLITACFFS